MNNELFRIVDSVAFDSPNVALSARQGYLLNQKISQLALFSVSDGLVPIGTVIATLGVFSAQNNEGTFTPAPIEDNNLVTTGKVSKNGFQLCDGAKITVEGVYNGFFNKYVPNLTDNRFLRGSSQSGILSTQNGANDGDNKVTLGLTELPSHTHIISPNPITISPHPATPMTSTGANSKGFSTSGNPTGVTVGTNEYPEISAFQGYPGFRTTRIQTNHDHVVTGYGQTFTLNSGGAGNFRLHYTADGDGATIGVT
jgi:hypothetical protein